MHRSLSTLCVLALVVASVGAATPLSGVASAGTASSAAPAATGPVTQAPNATSYLSLGSTVERDGLGTTELDVAGSLAVDSAALHSRYDELRFDERYQAAPNVSARQAVLQDIADHIERRIAALQEHEQAARAEYNAGQLTTERYLRRLAVIDTETARLGERVSQLSVRVDAVEGRPVSDRRLANMKADLIPLEGPVRDHATRAMAGESAPLRTYVEASGDGVVLATVRDPGPTTAQEFIREAYVASARDENRPNQFANGSQPPLDAAEERARALYPWMFENHQGYAIGLLSGGPPLRLAAVYPVTINHPRGVARQSDLVAYLDGGTTDVFREVQYLGVERVPTTRLGRERTEQLVLQVNATRPGGPAHATVTDTVGNPVSATVYVDGEERGRTGANGEHWFVAPRGRMNVTVVRADARATVVGTA